MCKSNDKRVMYVVFKRTWSVFLESWQTDNFSIIIWKWYKVSANEAKLTGLWTIQHVLISKCSFGPEKLTGFWRNGPRHRSISFFSWITKSQHYCTMHCWQSQAISRILNLKKKKSIKRFSFRFHDNSDVIVTLIITNFHLYLIQLWCSFLQIFVDGDVVNA